jgi:hypothetical protein
MKKLLRTSFFVLVLSIIAAPAYSEEMAIDEQKATLIGGWRCEWPGVSGDSSTLIIHEIDSEKGKARCTFIVQPGDAEKSEHEVLADFFAGANPKLTFKARGNDFTCVLYKDILSISFVGSVRGVPVSNSTTMYKYPKK